MSYKQININSGGSLVTVTPPIGPQIKPIDNSLFFLGGDNINTSASGNIVYTNLDENITLESINVGNLTIDIQKPTPSTAYQAFTVNNVPDENIIFSTTGNGELNLPNISTTNGIPVSITIAGGGIGLTTIRLDDGYLAIGTTLSPDASAGTAPGGFPLMAGTNVSIVNAPGSITISASGSSGTQAGAYSWNLKTFTGTEQKSFSLDRNIGIIANSSIVGPPTEEDFDFTSTSPIEYTIDSVEDWELGDCFFAMNRNKGNFIVNMPEDVSIWHTGFKRNKNSPKDFLKSVLVKKSSDTGQAAYVTSGNPVYPEVPANHAPISKYFNGAFGVYVGQLSYAVELNSGQPPTIGTREKAFVLLHSAGLIRATNATPQTTNFIHYQ